MEKLPTPVLSRPFGRSVKGAEEFLRTTGSLKLGLGQGMDTREFCRQIPGATACPRGFSLGCYGSSGASFHADPKTYFLSKQVTPRNVSSLVQSYVLPSHSAVHEADFAPACVSLILMASSGQRICPTVARRISGIEVEQPETITRTKAIILARRFIFAPLAFYALLLHPLYR